MLVVIIPYALHTFLPDQLGNTGLPQEVQYKTPAILNSQQGTSRSGSIAATVYAAICDPLRPHVKYRPAAPTNFQKCKDGWHTLVILAAISNCLKAAKECCQDPARLKKTRLAKQEAQVVLCEAPQGLCIPAHGALKYQLLLLLCAANMMVKPQSRLL